MTKVPNKFSSNTTKIGSIVCVTYPMTLNYQKCLTILLKRFCCLDSGKDTGIGEFPIKHLKISLEVLTFILKNNKNLSVRCHYYKMNCRIPKFSLHKRCKKRFLKISDLFRDGREYVMHSQIKGN